MHISARDWAMPETVFSEQDRIGITGKQAAREQERVRETDCKEAEKVSGNGLQERFGDGLRKGRKGSGNGLRKGGGTGFGNRACSLYKAAFRAEWT